MSGVMSGLLYVSWEKSGNVYIHFLSMKIRTDFKEDSPGI